MHLNINQLYMDSLAADPTLTSASQSSAALGSQRSAIASSCKASTAKTRSAMLPSLTGLRAVAALLVVISHVTGTGRTFGQVGVQIFFVLSSYLMCALYLEAPRRDTFPCRARFTLTFIRNRIARIVPLPVFLVVLSSVFHHLPNWRHYSVYTLIHPVWEYFALRQASGVMWTIALEFAFYLMFFIALLLPPHVARVSVGLFSTLSIGSFAFPPSRSFEALTGIRWGLVTGKSKVYKYFALGVLCYEIHRFVGTRRFKLRVRSFAGAFTHVVGCGLFVGMFALHVAAWYFSAKDNLWNSGLDAVWLCAVLLGSLYLSPIRFFLNFFVLQHIGKVSYSLYLTHMFVFVYFARRGMNNGALMNVLLFILAATALATLSFYTIEKPTNRLLRSKGASSALPKWATESAELSLPFCVRTMPQQLSSN